MARRAIATVVSLLLLPLLAPAATAGAATAGASDGYVVAAAVGGDVHGLGAAPFLGSLADTGVDSTVVGIAGTASGEGYWLTTADGQVHAFGDAGFYGDLTGQLLNQPIVGMAATARGEGYWLVAADGGLFAFGDAGFYGSMGGLPLNQPIAAMAPTQSGHGYWLFARDGGVFAYGDAAFLGSLGATGSPAAVVDAAPLRDGTGYWLVDEAGGVHAFGEATPLGGVSASGEEPVVAIAARPAGDGYWLATSPRPEYWPGAPLPPGTGFGQRIVYANSQQRIWLVGADNRVVDSYLVSGRQAVPAPGRYAVFSKSRHASAGHDGISMEYMVRFAHGRKLAIGFHAIPVYGNGRPMQSEDELGLYRSSGCVRQRRDKAAALFAWAPIGTPVVVLA
jgi:L,D-transpeptidase catalytic domain